MTNTRFNELKQRLVNDHGMTLVDAESKLIRNIKASMALESYNSLVDEISLKQLVAMTLNDHSLVARAHKIKKISKNKGVWYLANRILFLLGNDSTGLDALQIHNINQQIESRKGN